MAAWPRLSPINPMSTVDFRSWLSAVAGIVACSALTAAPLDLKEGDHVVLLGGSTAERLQHDGWLETLLVAANAEKNLVFRNLAFAGDEVATWHRVEGFGSREEWLKRVKADVILAFYGFNESFQGEAGLSRFREQLTAWVRETKAANYSGKGTPRVVLFTPLAQEAGEKFPVPDPSARNADLAKYAAVIKEVAAAEAVGVVDLFEISQRAYQEASAPLTHNGWQLTDAGNRLLAPRLAEALTGQVLPAPDERIASLNAAINDKNREWAMRYRTVDGYNIYGGRSGLAYEAGKRPFLQNTKNPDPPFISNFQVMQQEMAVRDTRTANRDRAVWAVAKGGVYAPDDSQLPPVSPVPTNIPGDRPDGSHTYLDGEEAIKKMTLHKDLEINLYASEKEFPDLINPVQMAWDTKGRLWVACWRNYPSRRPGSPHGDSLLIFEDTDGDGRADKRTVFLDNLNCPTGFQFYKDGVLLMQAPDLWFVRDSDGDDRADSIERVVMGLDSADSHHQTNSMVLEPGGAVYLSDGVFHRSQIETYKGPLRVVDGAIYRYEPQTGKLELYVKYNFANPHGRVFDRWGNDIITDATGNNNYFGPAFSGRLDQGNHRPLRDFWDRPSRPCAGTGLISSRHFPEDWQGNFLNLNVISFQGIFHVKVTEEGSGLKGETIDPIVFSSDDKFRPSAVSIGPDGAIYFCDWSNAIIGHMQHHLRDPNRDQEHGRIYRITYKGRPLLTPKKIAGEPVPALLELLKEPENNVRERAKIELGKYDSSEVVAAVQRWEAELSPDDPEVEHHRMEALWVHQWHDVVNRPLLEKMLRSPEPRARAAATRVLGYWRDRVPNALELLKVQAEDEHPRVRLEAVRVASFFDEPAAVDVALAVLKRPMDYYLEYTLGETIRQLDPVWRRVLAEGKPVAEGNPAGIDYLLANATVEDLLRFPRTDTVLNALLWRPGVPSTARLEALATLAEQQKTTLAGALVPVLAASTPEQAEIAGELATLLPTQSAEDLQPLLPQLIELSGKAASARVRAAAVAAAVAAKGAWEEVGPNAIAAGASYLTLLEAVPLAPQALRASAYPPVKRVVEAPAEQLASRWGAKDAPAARYVRIELPRRGTLTLAEVKVFAGHENIAPQGKASQSSTGYGGEASRAIDGNTSDRYGDGGQTHTQENEDHPWWELDLGREAQVTAVEIYNRFEGNESFRQRLDGYTLMLLDAQRRPIYQKAGLPAPANVARHEVAQDGVETLRAAAARALVSTGVEPEKAFVSLTQLLQKGEARSAVVASLRSLPRQVWNWPAAAQTAAAVLEWARQVPAAERTQPEFVETLQLAIDFAQAQPDEIGRQLARELRALSVNVYVIRAVHEQMRFDTTKLVVEAGKPFEVIFENDDIMPHNIVFVKPGTREAVAAAALTMPPTELDNQGRAYLPRSQRSAILGASKLLNHGERAVLKLTAPAEPGACEFVCTFPGHAPVMWGTLEVVADVEAYLQAQPAAEK